jgi:hypothetical protein
MGSDSSPAPEIGGADLPPSSPEARGLSSSAGSSTSDAAASGSAPRPSSRTTRNLLGGDLSVLHGDAVRDSSHERTSLTLLGPRLDSPRDSTAEGGVVPVLGSRAQITPTRRRRSPYFRGATRRQEALNAEGSSSAETPGAGSSPLEGGELFFPGGGTSFRFRRASTPPQSVSSAAYTVGGRRDDAEEGPSPFAAAPDFATTLRGRTSWAMSSSSPSAPPSATPPRLLRRVQAAPRWRRTSSVRSGAFRVGAERTPVDSVADSMNPLRRRHTSRAARSPAATPGHFFPAVHRWSGLPASKAASPRATSGRSSYLSASSTESSAPAGPLLDFGGFAFSMLLPKSLHGGSPYSTTTSSWRRGESTLMLGDPTAEATQP